jgi:CheY-like chemotaxis protein
VGGILSAFFREIGYTTMMTNDARTENVLASGSKRALRAGFAEHLSKPVELPRPAKVLERLLEGRARAADVKLDMSGARA